MNADADLSNSSVYYYDGDYPSPELSLFPENFDEVTKFQGLAFDVVRYREIASEEGGPVLELCCGTGRVAIPLAREGLSVTGVDISSGMLEQFAVNLKREEAAVAARIKTVRQDITSLALEENSFRLAIMAFNSLLCITDFAAQREALRAVSAHLTRGGLLVIDIVNPLNLKLQGDTLPRPFFTRKNPHNGNTYTRFAMMDAFDENHRQRLHGWYDEIDMEGRVRRQHYSMYWRPIFRFEIELMLKEAGFEIVQIEGGHMKEPYTAQSPRMFIRARKE
jgi:ubiquinone/menaquinone biosynthesis C-methylase UbiE